MGFFEDMVRTSRYTPPVGVDLGLPAGMAYSSYYPQYEIATPRYPYRNAYTLAHEGFKTNEVVYACIAKRAKARAEAPLWVYKDTGEHPEELPKHDLRKLLKLVNQGIGERQFWQICSISRDIAGFCAWEIEYNNLGDPVKLWFMRPDWCSFLRGPQKPLRAIRYQPWGLPPMDIPIENIYFHGDFDIQYPQILFYSPTMNALRQIGVDNSMTDFLVDFVQRGAKFSGLLTTDQTLTGDQAEDYQRRWQERYGGSRNWSEVGVLGKGLTYQTTQMNFNEMAFPELDARTETRICMAFEMSPILISARAGLNASTYSNYEQSHKAWYNEWVNPDWQIVGDNFGAQMLDKYESNPEDFFTAFNTSKVKALMEDQDALAKRATLLAGANVWSRNRALEAVGDDPVDFDESGKPVNVYVGSGGSSAGGFVEEEVDAGAVADPNAPANAPPDAKPDPLENLRADERAKFKLFARHRMKNKRPQDIAEYEFKYHTADEIKTIMAPYTGVLVVAGIEKALSVS
jgi:HK97 family phage portal protein